MAEESWDTAKVPQLVEGNYRLWAMKMQVDVEVEVKEGVTLEEALSKVLQKWIKAKMAKAQAEIVLWVEEDQLKLLEEEKDTHECWFKLRDTYRAKGFITELAKWWAFLLCADAGEALKEVNVEVDETQKVLVLIMGLMDKYGEWTFDQISVKILHEETRHDGPDGVSELEMASYVRSGGVKSKK
ncbi:uncharacterized protein LAESUDRAFT_759368 [Laetiporus sulphureus 93-53]|uniref:DUF4219 domain-containing protein n=1 Tax=Laetiporus sulphureus 93-53 TaxID=1314785 RepID=A0A165E9R3_9APHY|nr:uncharacterized protein LAESUDRAFT_759368 [Laetiporus sulphureus 93-53]KZT06546.1 hypothetical protein LAESUDRAFT_759368 [Laetiporus sulphureus 93-53]